MTVYALGILATFILSLIVTPLVRKFALHCGLVDQPNPRKMHRVPMARLGGVAIFGSLSLVVFQLLFYSDWAFEHFRSVRVEIGGLLLASVIAEHPNIHWRPVRIPKRLPSALLRYQAFAAGALLAIAPDRHQFDIVQLNGAITYVPSDVNIAMFVHSHWGKSSYHPSRIHRNAYGNYQRLFTSYNAAWERRAFRAATRVVALSAPVAESLIHDVGLTADRVETIEPGVDPEQFRPLSFGETNSLKALLNLQADHFVLFFVGDIRSNRKNLDLVLSVMPDLDNRVHLAVAGGVKGSPYPAMALSAGLADRVHFLGHRQDVSELIRGADAFVFPSHYDTFALVISEAMASGVPTITTPNVGAASNIENGENGFLLKNTSDRSGLLERIRQLQNNPALKQKIGTSGRETVSAPCLPSSQTTSPFIDECFPIRFSCN